jgi:uncharacterized HAD superfamily protein
MSEIFDDITDKRDDIFCIDIDGTLTEPHKGAPWDAIPRHDRIRKVNTLYDNGAIIYLMTARGFIHSSAKHDNISEAQTEADNFARSRTEAQLTKWGVKYHKLYFGKPRAVLYVDDRAMSDHEFFQD